MLRATCYVLHANPPLSPPGLGEQRQPRSLPEEGAGARHPDHHPVAQAGAQVSFFNLASRSLTQLVAAI